MIENSMVAGKLDLQKRQHRERAQPLKRQRFGLLEKHADYVKRARDFHSKEDRIKKLREKAAGRNKDEFYFGMIRSRTVKGVHVQGRGNESLPNDLVKVLKTQDAGYIRTQRAIEESRVERLQQQLHSLIDSPAPPPEDPNSDDDWDSFDAPAPSAPLRKHTLFSSSLSTVLSSDPLCLLRKRTPIAPTASSSKPAKRARKTAPLDPAVLAAEEEARTAAAAAHRTSLGQELEARKTRLAALSRALRELEVQRLLMGKGAKQSLVAKKGPKKEGNEEEEKDGLPEAEDGIATGARVWKWKAERKR